MSDKYTNATEGRDAIEDDMERRKSGEARITHLGQSGPELFITLSNGLTLTVEVLAVKQTNLKRRGVN